MISFPLFFPKYKDINEVITVLSADIGGTKTSLGLFITEGEKLKLLKDATFSSKQYPSFYDVIEQFLKENKPIFPDVLSIGVAGPVVNGAVKLTNLPWTLDRNQLRLETGIKEVYLLNDLEATAYGLAGVREDDLAYIYKSKQVIAGNMAVLAPGTGLGEAGMFWDGSAYRPFAAEGGHSEFSPRTNLDIELLRFLHNQYEIVSWEHLLSGAGIYNIYKFLRDVRGYKEPAWLSEKLETEDPAAVISHTAMRGLNDCCTQAMENYITYLAREATSLVLKLKATGGLVLGGGIPPKIYPLLRSELFHQEFQKSDRMELLLENVPIYIILNSKAALVGAAYYGAFAAISIS
jgi:glucokinase